MAVVDPPMVDVLPDKPRTRGIARTKAGKARTATRSVAARCAGMPSHQEPKINWTQPESRPVLYCVSSVLKLPSTGAETGSVGAHSRVSDKSALVRVVDLVIVVWVTCPCGRSGQVLDQLVRM